MQEEKIFIDQLKATSWPSDRTTFEKLPPRLQKGKTLSVLIAKITFSIFATDQRECVIFFPSIYSEAF